MTVHPLFLAVLSLSADAPAAVSAKPNIVVILADDLGYGDVGWHGGPYKTPHLDTLAKTNVRLEQHYCLPVCSPTRSSLLSGRFYSRFGCTPPTNPQVFILESCDGMSIFRNCTDISHPGHSSPGRGTSGK